MRRREFIVMLAGAAIGLPIAVRAQRTSTPVIGFLNSTEAYPSLLNEFYDGLAEIGFYEGRNVRIEYRWAEGQYDRLPELAADLVRHRVDVIVAAGGGTVSGLAAQAATNTIPIVVLSGADPVRSGLAASLSRPWGNITGVAQLVTAAEQKRFELLHELVPGASIAYLINPTWPNMEERTKALASREAALGTNVSILKASSDRDLPAAFDAVAQKGLGALLVSADPFFFMKRDQLVALAAARAIPTMYFFREFAAAGGLMSYGTKLTDGYRQLGVYTGRILKGAKPDELPIAQQSEKIELVINLKTAKALDIRVPPSLLVRADEVIE